MTATTWAIATPSACATASSPTAARTRTFEPLWWRTWRYLDLDITTGAQPLTLDSLKAEFTAYPFKELATFQSGDPDLDKIWQISWRTARLDAHETYMDTPYYEQLPVRGRYPHPGPHLLCSRGRRPASSSGPRRPSTIPAPPTGLTRSRYPSALPQTIPTVFPAVGRHAPRLLDVSSRSRAGARLTPWQPRRAGLVCRA